MSVNESGVSSFFLVHIALPSEEYEKGGDGPEGLSFCLGALSSLNQKNTYRFEFLEKCHTATHVTVKVVGASALLKIPFPVGVIQFCFSDIILEIIVNGF